LRRVGPRDQAALGPGVSRTRGDIIGVEQIAEARIKYFVYGGMPSEQKLFEEPGGMRPMPFDRARIGHRLHCLVLGGERRGAALGLASHRLISLEPGRARIRAGY